MLNGKKILSVCGAVALLLGVGMNLRHSLNDYGMGTNLSLIHICIQGNENRQMSPVSINFFIFPLIR